MLSLLKDELETAAAGKDTWRPCFLRKFSQQYFLKKTFCPDFQHFRAKGFFKKNLLLAFHTVEVVNLEFANSELRNPKSPKIQIARAP
jgi:hypothetical protein